MSYKLIYRIPFKSLNNISYVVEIEKKDYTGEVTELIGGESPFSLDLGDEDFLYTKVKKSNATLRVVGVDELNKLFSQDYRQFKVKLKSNDKLRWIGFIKPEIYTQEYSSTISELEIECYGCLSVLEFLKYKQKAGQIKELLGFISLLDLIKLMVKETGYEFNNIIIPHVYGRNLGTLKENQNFLDIIDVSEQNFFDEDNEPMNLLEVLEEICKFTGWSCSDWNGSLVFSDVDHKGKSFKYSGDFKSFEMIDTETLNVQNIGFMGSEHSLDIVPGYNKVTIKNSNYSPDNLLDFKIEYDDLFPLNSYNFIDGDRYKGNFYKIDQYNSGNYNMRQFKNDGMVADLTQYEGLPYTAWTELTGSIPFKYSNWQTDKGVPNIKEHSYQECIRLRLKGERGGGISPITASLVVSVPPLAYPDGCVCIECSAKYFNDPQMLPFKHTTFSNDLLIAYKLTIGDRDFTTQHELTGGIQPVRCDFLNFGTYDKNKEFNEIKNDKTLDMPYDGAKGRILKITKPINALNSGALTFSLLSQIHPLDAYGAIIKDLKIKFIPENGKKGVEKEDKIYENVVNDNFINELDEIELKINSYVEGEGASFSKALFKGTGGVHGYYVKDNVYYINSDSFIRPEELLINRIIERYKTTKLKLTQILKYSDLINPITILTDNTQQNKNFVITGGEIDFAFEEFKCNMIEL